MTDAVGPPPEGTESIPKVTPLQKAAIITQLLREKDEARHGQKNLNLLDESEPFQKLCDACRRGDVRAVQSLISVHNVNLNNVDAYDYPPLTLASLCGHYEVVRLLLESGAVCDRDTFQGERCLYNALNEPIRKLLLQYDYSKSNDPLQPWASGISSLLTSPAYDTTDITVSATSNEPPFIYEFRLHKFLLSARSPYFRRKFTEALKKADEKGHPELIHHIKLSSSIDARAFETAVRFLYLCDVNEVRSEEVFTNLTKLATHMEHPELLDLVLVANDAKQRRAKHKSAVESAQLQIDQYFSDFILAHKVPYHPPNTIPQHNPTFADIAILAEQPPQTLYPVHRAMLRSDFFTTMFTSSFREAQRPAHDNPHAAVPTIPLDAPPEIIEHLLRFFYSEKLPHLPLPHALDLLYLADSLFIPRLKILCAQVISTAGNTDDLPFSIYDVIRAGWQCRMRRLEEFGARYIAERLERFLGEAEFAELVAESADRIRERQETDTIELVDDVRYYLDQRFRLRMEELGGEEMYDENPESKEDGVEGVERLKEKEEEGEEEEEEEEEDFFGNEARQYEDLLGRIDVLLENLKLEA
ncbi:hypothetical protein EX30DRAFT_356945 [Ascodesmis nigricans]|uniref:BTB domain-containing protein n=1 Tax=Ascodesmis nigricans TaxID=341454 RepID=A0A4S2N692_9PEZI|nr:hypothetical protein EX30DRAFT_356945 [Ascodesmis nigricans]